MSFPFMGEMMTCAVCGRRQRSDPHRSSDWRLMKLDQDSYYVCTDHFPPDGSSADAFEQAYVTILEILLTKRANQIL